MILAFDTETTGKAHFHKHAFGEEFEGAHDAMADVRACLLLYRWIKEQTAPKEVECLKP